jgi:tellurite resistance protein TehA-like permease
MTTSRLSLIETGVNLEGSAAVSIVIPASFFGTVLGLVGLANVWRAANNLWDLPGWMGETIMLLAFIVWICLLLLYLSKWIWHRQEAIAEVEDPVQCSRSAMRENNHLLRSRIKYQPKYKN